MICLNLSKLKVCVLHVVWFMIRASCCRIVGKSIFCLHGMMHPNMHSVVGACYSLTSRTKGTIVGAYVDASQLDLSPLQCNKYKGVKNHYSYIYICLLFPKRGSKWVKSIPVHRFLLIILISVLPLPYQLLFQWSTSPIMMSILISHDISQFHFVN